MQVISPCYGRKEVGESVREFHAKRSDTRLEVVGVVDVDGDVLAALTCSLEGKEVVLKKKVQKQI